MLYDISKKTKTKNILELNFLKFVLWSFIPFPDFSIKTLILLKNKVIHALFCDVIKEAIFPKFKPVSSIFFGL